ncbi:unnamed protein product [Lota lota]
MSRGLESARSPSALSLRSQQTNTALLLLTEAGAVGAPLDPEAGGHKGKGGRGQTAPAARGHGWLEGRGRGGGEPSSGPAAAQRQAKGALPWRRRWRDHEHVDARTRARHDAPT